MGVLALFRQGGPLGNAEPVLFVGDDQPQILEDRGLRQKGVGADDQPGFAGGYQLPGHPLFLGGHGAGEQNGVHAQLAQKFAQGFIVLFR